MHVWQLIFYRKSKCTLPVLDGASCGSHACCAVARIRYELPHHPFQHDLVNIEALVINGEVFTKQE